MQNSILHVNHHSNSFLMNIRNVCNKNWLHLFAIIYFAVKHVQAVWSQFLIFYKSGFPIQTIAVAPPSGPLAHKASQGSLAWVWTWVQICKMLGEWEGHFSF